MKLSGSEIVSEIYEASFVPELWPRVIQSVAALSDTYGGVLFVDGLHGLKWTASDNMQDIMQGFVDGGWNDGNTRTANRLRLNHAGFLTDLDLFTAEQLAVEPMYVDYFNPCGLGWSTSTAILPGNSDVIVFDLEQRKENGPVSRETICQLDQLRPHIARASIAACRLGLTQVHSTVNAFRLIGLPAAIVSSRGRLVATNDLFENLTAQIKFLARDCLQFRHPAAQHSFISLAERGADELSTGFSFALPAAGESASAVVHVIPLQGASRDIFVRGDFVLLVLPVGKQLVPPAGILATLFDLTPAESRVAHGIANAQTVDEIAASLDISPNTARTHKRVVFAKLGVARNTELVALIGSVSTKGNQ